VSSTSATLSLTLACAVDLLQLASNVVNPLDEAAAVDL
jgi:hypothetical protein